MPVREVERTHTISDVIEWVAYFKIQNDEIETIQQKNQQLGKLKQGYHK